MERLKIGSSELVQNDSIGWTGTNNESWSQLVSCLSTMGEGDSILSNSFFDEVLFQVASPELNSDPSSEYREVIGSQIGRYQVESFLGAGGMGYVFKARDTVLNRSVAIKMLRKADRTNAKRKKLFKNERRCAASVDHPNVAKVFCEEEEITAIPMEYVEGKTLRAIVGHEGVDQTQALVFAGQIAAGLAAIHAAGVVHRDIKPENVLVTGENNTKIIDFGIACQWQNEKSDALFNEVDAETRAAGTPRYMAPEQRSGSAANPRADIYAYGVLFVELLTGLTPSKLESTQCKEADCVVVVDDNDVTPPWLVALQNRISVSTDIQDILQRCLAEDPDSRFSDGMALQDAIGCVSRDLMS